MEQHKIADGGLQFVPQIAAVQYVYLDFDGELTSYNGEILTVENVEVQHSELSEERIQNILAELNAKYASENVIFVTEIPAEAEYSTIYVGKTEAFKPYGSFAGLAETLDENNEIKTDKAFVMLNSTNSNEEIIAVISHETDHLTGTLTHGGEGINAYAAKTIISSGTTSTGLIISSGDSITVASGGIANSTTVNDWGFLYISKGGVASDTTVSGGGRLIVYKGGTADNAVVESYGFIVVSSGGTATNIIENGGYVSVVEGANVTFGSNTIEGMVLQSYNSVTVHSNTVASNITISLGLFEIYDGGIINSASINRGGLAIYSGGTATDITVSSGARLLMAVAPGTFVQGNYNGSAFEVKDAYISGYTVNTNCYLQVSSGGMASDTVVNTSGSMYIAIGGSAANIVAYEGAYLGITVASDTYIQGSYNGSAFETKDAQISDYTVQSGNNMIISNGGTATRTAVNASGWLAVSNGGTVNSIAVNSGGNVRVGSGGTVDNVTVSSGGSMYITRGTSVTNFTASSGAVIAVTVAKDTCVKGTYDGYAFEVNNSQISDCTCIGQMQIHIASAGTANNITLDAGGYMYVSNYGTANSTVINSGTVLVSKGGVANSTTVNSDGTMRISSGGVANSTTVNRGAMYIHSGGSATALTLSAGGMLNCFSFAEDKYWSNITNGSASVADNVYILDNTMNISSGGVADNTTVNGWMYLSNGGVANSTTVDNGGYMYISSGGVADSTTVNSGGDMYILGDGTANSTTVNSSGYIYIYGVHCGSLAIESGASVSVLDGGVIDFTVAGRTADDEYLINDLALITGAPTYTITVDYYQAAGTYKLAQGADAFEGTITIGDGTTDFGSITVNGDAFSYNNATYTLTQTNGDLLLDIEIKAADPAVFIYSSGTLVSSGSVIDNAIIVSGGNDIMHISSGGVANSTTVNSSGYIHISNGGVANDTTINSRGNMYISNGGVANSTTVNSGGWMTIRSGGTATNIIAADSAFLRIVVAPDTYVQGTYAGSAFEMKDAYISGYTLNRNCDMDISSGGVADSTTVNSGGWMVIDSGVANSTTVNSGGSLSIHSGGTATNIVAEDGARVNIPVASNTYIQGTYNGSAFEMKDAYISGYTVNSGGKMRISSGGVADSTTLNHGSMSISSGGVANYIDVNGIVDIYSGGVANNTITNSGWMHIFCGGVANSTTVNSGGSMDLSSGGTHRGSLSIAEGAVVEAYEGSIIDFTVAGRTVEDDYLINNLSLLGGTPTYTITVDATQADGTYKLAQGAESFAGTVTVGDGSTDYGTLTVNGGALSYNNVTYTLTQTDGDLLLDVAGEPAVFIYNEYGSLISSGVVIENVGFSSAGSAVVTDGGVLNSVSIANGKDSNKVDFDIYISSGGAVNNASLETGAVHVFDGGVLNSALLDNDPDGSEKGSAFISSGGVANDTSVTGYMYISSGGVANNTFVTGGNMVVSSGAVANVISMYSGDLSIDEGASATSVTIGGYGLVGIGGVVNDLTLNDGEVSIGSVGVVNNITLNDGLLSIGGTVSNTTISDEYGSMYINSNGVASNTTVNSGGSMIISSGGVADDTVVNGYMTLSSGASANNILQHSGTILVYSGANVSSLEVTGGWTTISGGSIHDAELASGGYLKVYSNGEVANLQISDSSFLHLYSGVASDTVVNSGGSMIISSGGVHRGTLTIADGAIVSASEGGIIDFTVAGRTIEDGYIINNMALISETPTYTITVDADQALGTYKLAQGAESFAGTVTVGDGSTDYGTLTINGGTLLYNDVNYSLTQSAGNLTLSIDRNEPVLIFSSGVVTAFTSRAVGEILGAGGNNSMTVVSGGIADHTMVNSGGSMHIHSGGVASATTINKAGSMAISGGGAASDTVVNSGGSMRLLARGLATDTTVGANGYMYVGAISAIASNVTVESRGTLNIQRGSAVNIVASSGARLMITVVANTYIQGSYNGSAFEMKDAYISGYTIHSGGQMRISSGGVAIDTVVGSRGMLMIGTVNGGGVASNTVINSGGSMRINSGGVHRGTLTADYGAVVSAWDGSIIDFTVAGRTAEDDYIISNLSVISGAPTYTITVDADQASGVYKLAQKAWNCPNITIGDGTTTYGQLTLNGSQLKYNGTVYMLTLDMEENLTLSVFGESGVLIFNNSTLTYAGDVANDVLLVSSGNNLMKVSDGGVAENTAIQAFTSMHIASGGVAENTTVKSNGVMYISQGGSANGITAEAGAKLVITAADDTYISGSYAGTAFEMNDGYIADFAVNSNVKMYVADGGNASGIAVNRGGYVQLSGGVAAGTVVNSRGTVEVVSGGVASDTVVNERGILYISSGGVHRGTLTIANGATVSAYDGSTIDFTAATGTADADYLINDLALLQGSATFTLTVTDNQASGVYKLAQGANGFEGSISIGNGTLEYGTITVNGSAFEYNNVTYTLTQTNGNLLLDVQNANDPDAVFIYSNGTLISSGTVIDNAVVSRVEVHVSNGGVVNNLAARTVSMYISSGGVVNDISVLGGSMHISSGGTVTHAIASQGMQIFVYEGGKISSMTYLSGGRMTLSNGGVAEATTLNSKAILYVRGGIADSTVINSGGIMSIVSGGVASNTVVSSGGSLSIVRGTHCGSLTIEEGAIVVTNGTGSYIDFTLIGRTAKDDYLINNMSLIDGSFSCTITVSADQALGTYKLAQGAENFTGSITITDGTTDYGEVNTLYANENQLEFNGVTYTLTNIDGNLQLDIFKPVVEYSVSGYVSTGAIVDNVIADYMYISSGGVANNTLLTSYGRMYISSGGVANNTLLTSCGSMYISSGGVVNSTTVASSSYLNISSGGVANDTVTDYGGKLYVNGGATLNNTVVNSYGSVFVSSGGVVNSTTVASSSYLNISSGGVANYTTVESMGIVRVIKGGSANFAEISVSGRMFVYSGGTARNITVNSRGYLYVSGSADHIAVNSGYMHVRLGGVARFTEITGKLGYVTVREDGVMSDTTINSGGRLFIAPAGTAVDNTVNASGIMNISQGGVASNTVVASMGRINIYNGGVHRGSLTIEDGAIISAGTGGVIDFTLAGRTAEDGYLINDISQITGTPVYTVTVSADQALGMYKLAQGAEDFSNTITIGDGTVEYGTISLSNVDLTYDDRRYHLNDVDGNLTLSVYHNAPVLIYQNNDLYHSGAEVTGETLDADYTMHIFDSGVANGTVLNADGNMYIYNGGTASNTIINDNGYISISKDGVANNTTVNSGASMHIASGGAASGIIAAEGARLNMLVASNTYIQGSYNGSAFEMQNARIADYTVNSGVTMHILHGGAASNTAVRTGGEMYISSGAVHRGSLSVESGAVVSAYKGSTIDFTIAERTAEDDYLINDLSLIAGTPNYTITVLNEQVPGVYKLAQGAENFAGTMTVGDGTINYGTVAVNGGTLDIGRYNYTLAVNANGDMHLTVGFNTRYGLGFDPDGYDNDTFDTALVLEGTVGSLDQLTIDSAEDVDCYKFTLDTAGRAGNAITIDFKVWKGNLDLYLYDSEGNLVKEAKTASDNETLSLHQLAKGDYYLKVAGFDGNTNEYTLKWELPTAVTLQDETECGNDKSHSYHLGKLKESVSLNAAITDASDEDWFKFNLEKGMTSADSISITYDSADADLELYIYGANGKDLIGRGVKTTDGGFTTSTINFANYKHGVYYVRVISSDGGTAEYTLNANIISTSIKRDKFEDNNSVNKATNLSTLSGAGTIENLSIHTGKDEDYFRFNMLEDGSVADYIAVNYEFLPGGDIDIDILDANGQRVGYAHSAEGPDRVSLDGLKAGEYYIRVYGYDGAVNNYTLEYNITNSSLISSDAYEGVEHANGGFIDIRQDQTISNLSISSAKRDDENTADTFKITLDYDAWKSSKIILADYRPDWKGLNYVLTDADGNEIVSGIGAEISLAGLKKGDYYLSVDTPQAGQYSEYSVTAQGVPDHQKADNANKWSIFIYLAGDNNLEAAYLKELMYMHQKRLPAGVEVYVLFDRAEKANPTEEDWNGTRVCKIVYNNGFSDYIEWMQLGDQDEWDTGNVATLEAFLDWGMEIGSADNYALIMKDHGTSLGFNSKDETDKSIMDITDIADLLKKSKYDDLSLVAFDQCLMGSDVVISAMEGVVDYVVASESVGYTPNLLMRYKELFRNLTSGMTTLELAQKIVNSMNVSSDHSMTLAAFDTSEAYLSTALNEFAQQTRYFTYEDWSVLCNSFKTAANYGDEICAFSDLISILEATLTSNSISDTLRNAVNKLIDDVNEKVIKSSLATPSTYGNGLAVFNPVLSDPLMNQYAYYYGSTLDYYSSGIGQTAWGTFLNNVGKLSGAVSDYLNNTGTLTFDDFNYCYEDDNKKVIIDIGAYSGNGLTFEGLYVAESARFGIEIFQTNENDTIRIIADDPYANISISLVQTNLTESGEEREVLLTGTDGVLSLGELDFLGMDSSDYEIVVNTDRATSYTMSFEADWTTGVDRFDFARTGSIDSVKGGNNILDKATVLAAGTYTGLMTSAGDADYYLLSTVFTDNLDVTVTGEGLIVQEFNAAGELIQSAESQNGKYILNVQNGNYLYIEGKADISSNQVNSYKLEISDISSAYIAPTPETIVAPPTITVNADTETLTKELVVTVTVAENVKSYYTSDITNNDSWSEFSNSITLSANGRYFFKAIDTQTGSESQHYTELNVENIDNVAPVLDVVFTDIDTTEWTTDTVELTATATDDNGAKIYYKKSTDDVFSEYTDTLTVEEYAEYIFYAEDSLGNKTEQLFITARIDKVAPILEITGNVTDWTNEDIVLTAQYRDDLSGIESISYFNGDAWIEGSSLTVTENGVYTFMVKDAAGNVTTQAVKVDKIDKDAPTLEISGNATDWTKSDVTLTAKASDGTVEYWNGTNWVIGNTVTATENGTYTFRVTDQAGNETQKSVVVDKIDKDILVLKISANPERWTNQDVTLVASSNKNGTFEFYNGTEWVTGNKLTVSENGTYTFRVTDRVGNVIEQSVTVDNIDKVAPTLEISGNPTEWTNQNVTLKAIVSDGTVMFNNGTIWLTGSEFTVSKNGTYKFRVTDRAGNETEKTVVVDKIDKVAPDVPVITSTKLGNTSNQPVELSVEAGNDTIEYSLDGEIWNT
ncbi:MAG: hypothetical protein E7039_06420, partial [Lentisphaerae bacterium]|nr:hypothetical protein [Lentisphaerota bacterium]